MDNLGLYLFDILIINFMLFDLMILLFFFYFIDDSGGMEFILVFRVILFLYVIDFEDFERLIIGLFEIEY